MPWRGTQWEIIISLSIVYRYMGYMSQSMGLSYSDPYILDGAKSVTVTNNMCIQYTVISLEFRKQSKLLSHGEGDVFWTVARDWQVNSSKYGPLTLRVNSYDSSQNIYMKWIVLLPDCMSDTCVRE